MKAEELQYQESEGHVAFVGRFEYLVCNNGLYRAPRSCPIRTDVPVRNGARWENAASRAHEVVQRDLVWLTKTEQEWAAWAENFTCRASGAATPDLRDTFERLAAFCSERA